MGYKLHPEEFWIALNAHVDTPTRMRIEKVADTANESVPIIISQLGLAADEDVVSAYQNAFNIPSAPISMFPESAVFSTKLSTLFLKSRKALPFRDAGNTLDVAMVDPLDIDAISGITFAMGKTVKPYVISLSNWQSAFDLLYPGMAYQDDDKNNVVGLLAGWTDDDGRLKDLASDAPVIRQVEKLLQQASDMGASDIHVEPAPNETRVRFRVDGDMQAPLSYSPNMAARITSRVKVMCDMDVADRRRPQDGRTSTAVRGRPVDLRVSTVPTAYGESLAIRLLDRASSLMNLEGLGFSERDLTIISDIIKNPRGIFLVTGPTGSGKTTTLYSVLNKLRQNARKILTAEDPIEYFFDDINQVQVNAAAGVTFASALRSFLRQDPDIIMVGEIRDPETARIAVQAALTGHLVLSSLHTNNALSSVDRLKDMGIEAYLIASTLSGVTGQRLVKKLCAGCRVQASGTHEKQYAAKGCKDCTDTGYRGRTVISESLQCTPEISGLIRQGAGQDVLLRTAKDQGMVSMLEDGQNKASAGIVALTNVYAAIGKI